ncbi:CoA transferase [Novosphingobium sp. KCTC 2891]|uniref:CaiB/BaiF CoA-transferase family protein n=1 Tax=Novosphingobium sp. KCTC 2891 TaxID=2989730 RepID=UPI0022221031|nr:CoA transferase [Novosphingobium sp. KCTC 2891]MCW1384097.1 CoA transferase [Novosphingobium sp. KCTC 2891]
MTELSADRPLAGIRIVDAVSGPLASITRHLADLGARVDRFGGAEGHSPAQAGKVLHDTAVTSPDGLAAARAADIVVVDAAQWGALAALRQDRPELVSMAVSPFGAETCLSAWQATGPVLHAMTAMLSRSGIGLNKPLVPPGDLAHQCAAAQAAFVLVGALYRALGSGVGAHFDFAALEGAVQALDPGFGINGSATLGKPVGLLDRARPPMGKLYPIFACADGAVRICLLAKRQWRGMFAWMGEPEQFASPEFDQMAHRFASPDLVPFMAGFFAGRTRGELEREGQLHGVPIAALQDIAGFIASDHAAARQAVVTRPDGSRLPNGVLTVDGARMGPLEAVPGGTFPQALERTSAGLPLAGLRVLDLGVIVVGAEQGRLLGDLGADVLKIESQSFPDGSRQSYLKHGMSVSFGAGHRNKRSVGLDLRSEEGKALFLDLVGKADVVCSNFKPGTLEKLGLGRDVLRAINPRIVLSESSAFGDSGPWSGRMGYGPLVRAATGLTAAWRYPDDPESFSDAITVYPDHVAGRICAMGVVALLIRRLRTGGGGLSCVSQAEVMLSHFAEYVPAGAITGPVDAPWGVFPAKGEDEWIVVTVRTNAEWQRLCERIGFAGGHALDTAEKRLAASAEIDARVGAWTAEREATAAAEELQALGIPAAPMLRLVDLPDHPWYRQRGFFRPETHPWMREMVMGESYVAVSADLPPPPARPAPLAGEQTIEALAEWLGLAPEEFDALCAAGVLEPTPENVLAHAREHIGVLAAG